MHEQIVEVVQFLFLHPLGHFHKGGCAAGIVIGTMVYLVLFNGIVQQAVAIFAIAKVVVMCTHHYRVFGTIVNICGNIGAGAFRFIDGNIKVYGYAAFLFCRPGFNMIFVGPEINEHYRYFQRVML